MPHVELTSHLTRQVACAPKSVNGRTVREALDAYFQTFPLVRSYVLDEQGHLRQHVVIFVDGEMMRDRRQQAQPVSEATQIYIMQALSGGS